MLKEENAHHDTLSCQGNVLTMEGPKQPQQANDGNDISEEITNLTISENQEKKTSSTSTEEQEDTAATTNQSSAENTRKMKLIVRSQYWGRTLKGKARRAPGDRPYRTISSQAVLYNTDEYWGCCPHHGKRVLELQECHFADCESEHDWDLYLVGSWVSPTHAIHDFLLFPQNQTAIDVNRNTLVHGWSYVGTCSASCVRMDLDGMLRGLLQQNDSYGYRYHHAHVEIMMDKAFDRETPRSRKMSNEKNRQDRQLGKGQQQESSESTDGTSSTAEREGPPSSAGFGSTSNSPFVKRSSLSPPIPHVISNDSSSIFSHSMASTPVAYADMSWGSPVEPPSYWTGAPQGHYVPASGPASAGGNPHPGMQWHPGSTLPLPGSHGQQQVPWQHLQGITSSGAPPPPPPIHGQMSSPSMGYPYHQPTSDLQQYLMYSDTLPTGHYHIRQHNHHHHHHGPGFSSTPALNPPYAMDSHPKRVVPREIVSGHVAADGTGSSGLILGSAMVDSETIATRNTDDGKTDTAPHSTETENGNTITSTSLATSPCWTNGNNSGLPPRRSDSHGSY